MFCLPVLDLMLTRKVALSVLLILSCELCAVAVFADTQSRTLNDQHHPVEALLNERLVYDISFLWFDHLAEGFIECTPGPDDGTFLVTMEAKTLGVAAFFTRNRVEKFQTLMRIGDQGLLQPLWHSSHTLRDRAESRSEKITQYTFDYKSRQVRFQKIKNGQAYADQWFDMVDEQIFDILSALYNLRLGFFGPVGQQRILIPTFHRKGRQEIIVAPLLNISKKDERFFAPDPIRTRILVDPSVFGTKGRDIFAGFDSSLRPQRGIIKNVIGLGDVKGVLRSPAHHQGG